MAPEPKLMTFLLVKIAAAARTWLGWQDVIGLFGCIMAHRPAELKLAHWKFRLKLATVHESRRAEGTYLLWAYLQSTSSL